MTCNALTYNLF